MASELIKSVRIRPIKEPSGYKSGAFEGGSLDYNVSIFRSGRRERWCAAFKLRSNGENSTAAWFQLTYSGRRYEDKTDDEIIAEFIKTNTVRENPTLKDGLIDITENGETKSVPFYQIIQDPFDKIPPPSRRYGSDPYHLNNGAQVFIRWFSGKPESVYYAYNNLTTASQSAIGEVTVQIVTNEPGKEPLVFTYSSANNPLQPGVTPSYNDMETYLEYTYGSISSESSFVGYKRPPEKFIDPDNLQLVSGVQYGRKSDNQNSTQGFGQIDGFIDDARDSITQSISIKPEGLIKKVEVVPPDGQPIWGLPSEIGDYGFDFSSTSPIYLTDLSSSTSSGTQSESTNKVSEKYFYDYSYEGNFNQGQDWMIIDELLKAWNKKFPGYNVALNEPSYLYVSDFVKKEYKDPVKTLDEVVAEEDLQDPAPNITATESNLIKLNILFPTEFEVEARKDCPDFRIFVGDIPTELLPGEGFQFQDDFNELEELDPEYQESPFSGEEESPSQIPEVTEEQSKKEEKSTQSEFTEAPVSTTPGQVVKLPETYSHTSNQGFNLLNSQWIGDLVASAKSHIKHPTYDIDGTEKGNLGCASAVSMMFYRAFGVHMKTGKEVKSVPKSIGDFGSKGTSELGGWFEAAPSLYKKIPWESAQPGDIMNTARNFSTNKAGHIGVVIDVKDSDGSWAIVSNSSKGFAGGGGGAIKQNYSVKKWKSVTSRNPSKTFAFRYIGPSLANKQA